MRRIHGMDQQTLADKLGRKSVSSISEWEKGKYTPKAGILADIAFIFNVRLDDLMNKDLRSTMKPSKDIGSLFNKLVPERQDKVYDFAEQQYNEQNNVIRMPKQHEVKVYGAVSAGTGEYLLDNEPEVMPFQGEVPDKYDFAVVVNGDSMLPLFENQQIIFVRKTTDIRSGQIVVVDYDQQAYVKKYISDEHSKRFVSLNKKYDDMPINVDHEAKAFGVVVL
ncbi:helix-turn-helix domain-containing protein [Leuconostoc fallax]|nr:helix-turn-helix domain-containing protein [Leuconostoc fallax]